MKDSEIDRVTSLPEGFSRGSVVALLDIGETVMVEDAATRSTPEVEAGAVATGKAMGRYLTTIERAVWLRAPGFPIRGKPAVFEVDLPVDLLLPEDNEYRSLVIEGDTK